MVSHRMIKQMNHLLLSPQLTLLDMFWSTVLCFLYVWDIFGNQSKILIYKMVHNMAIQTEPLYFIELPLCNWSFEGEKNTYFMQPFSMAPFEIDSRKTNKQRLAFVLTSAATILWLHTFYLSSSNIFAMQAKDRKRFPSKQKLCLIAKSNIFQKR